MEKYEEYVDRLGRRFIAVNPDDYGYGEWFRSMLRSTDLSDLVMMYPYCNLMADPQFQYLIPVDGRNYYGKITNMFHVLYAKWQDQLRPITTIPDQEYFEFRPNVPEEDVPVERNIAYPTPEQIVMGEEETYAPDFENMPEVIVIKPLPAGWHPNKDANGNYMSPNQYTNNYYGYPYGGYNNYGYVGGGYNPYYYGGGGYVGTPSGMNQYGYGSYPWNNPQNLPHYNNYPF